MVSLAVDVQVNTGHVLAREDADLSFVVIYSKLNRDCR